MFSENLVSQILDLRQISIMIMSSPAARALDLFVDDLIRSTTHEIIHVIAKLVSKQWVLSSNVVLLFFLQMRPSTAPSSGSTGTATSTVAKPTGERGHHSSHQFERCIFLGSRL